MSSRARLLVKMARKQGEKDKSRKGVTYEEKIPTKIGFVKTQEWLYESNFDDILMEFDNNSNLQQNAGINQQGFAEPVQEESGIACFNTPTDAYAFTECSPLKIDASKNRTELKTFWSEQLTDSALRKNENELTFVDNVTNRLGLTHHCNKLSKICNGGDICACSHISDSESIESKEELMGDYSIIEESISDANVSNSPMNKINDSNILEVDDIASDRLSEKIIQKKRSGKKVIRCKYCEDDVTTKNFMRHLQRNHKTENDVQDIFQYPKNSKERRRAVMLFRNSTNFDLYINGIIRSNRQRTKVDENITYYPCAYCKGVFDKKYLKRHAKSCLVQKSTTNRSNERRNHVSNSQTVTACAMDPTNVISKLNVKEQVFNLMKGDQIAFVAKKDLLIAHFGETYLMQHKREGLAYSCSNRMRELSRLLISYRKIIGNEDIGFKDILHPKNFDRVINAVREISGYDHIKKTFKAPSLAMHLGTSLKLACDELRHLILKESKGYKCKSVDELKMWLENVKYFKQLVNTRWSKELASLANKDLSEKRLNKPLLLPLVSDIKKFRDGVLKIAHQCENKILDDNDETAYKLLVDCTLALLIVFNRRRIGDVQYLKIKDYNSDKRSNVLTDAEKILTTKYKRVVNGGKGSRAVVILVPEILQTFINLLLEHRAKYIPPENEYVFAIPRSTIKWRKGDVAIRTLSKKINLEHPEAISSNKLRKHIATVMQILNLSRDESKQFANFMGHTQKTHDEFYELPVDIYQTAKVSKLLLMIEKGSVPIKYKGKSLSEINLDPATEYAEEDEGVLFLDNDEDKVVLTERTTNEKREHKDFDEKKGDVPKKTKECIRRQHWSDQEITLIQERFASDIRNKSYPSAEEIKDFIKKINIKRTVPQIKAKIQHLIKLNTLK